MQKDPTTNKRVDEHRPWQQLMHVYDNGHGVAFLNRFRFEEREPRYDLLAMDREVDGVHLGRLLRRINDRLEYLLIDD